MKFFKGIKLLLCMLLFGCSVHVLAQESKSNKPVIRLKQGEVTVTENIDSFILANHLPEVTLVNGRYYLLATFRAIPTIDQTTELASHGVTLLQYLPENTYWVSIDALTNLSALKPIGLYALTVPTARHKSSPLLWQQPLPEWTRNGSDQVALKLFYFHNCPFNAIQAYLNSKGLLINSHREQARVIELSVPETLLEELCLQPFVQYIDTHDPPLKPDNQPGTATHRTNVLSSSIAGRNLKGSGVAIGIGDGGYVTPHIDFQNRQTNFATGVLGGWGDHADHVTGTIGGAGLINSNYTGMAPKATLYNHQATLIVSNTAYYFSTYGIVLTNNSYGFVGSCSTFGQYDGNSVYLDQDLNLNTAVNHVFAASNDGNSSCSPYPSGFATMSSGLGASKNVLTVGAVSDLDALATFSSRGPCKDGRLKPDICGVGTTVTSTVPTNSYGIKNGTSMATPGVTGTLALLYERYRQLYGGANPDGSLIKAIVMNSADDIGNPGPDFRHGYGRLNARRAVETLEAGNYNNGSIVQNDSIGQIITIPSGAVQLKVMVYWRDKEGSASATYALVNNIDLHVTDPSSVLYRPWVLDTNAALVNSNATRGIDNLNNAEQVTIDNPAAGDYIISLLGTNIPSGSQLFFVTWEIIMPSITFTNPAGGEQWRPGSVQRLRYDMYGVTSGTFNLEYSTNGGSSWNSITTFSYTNSVIDWTVPNVSSANCVLRVRHNTTTSIADTSNTFTIAGTPDLIASSTTSCGNQILLQWSAISGASSYDVLMLKGSNWSLIGNTNKTYYSANGLDAGTTYWFNIRTVGSGGEISMLDTALAVTATATACSYTSSDVGVESIISPLGGRVNTSSALTNTQTITVSLKNYGTSAASGFPVNYQLNGGTVVTETYTGTLAANGVANFSFSTTASMGTTGTYVLKAWTGMVSDSIASNDSYQRNIYFLVNSAETLPYTDGFESASDTTVNSEYMGVAGMSHWDYQNSSAECRLRTTGSAALTKTGSRSIFLDKSVNSGTADYNYLTLTLNLSNYTPSGGLLLNFSYAHTGEEQNNNDSVWVRGSDTSAWIPVYSLWANKATAGTFSNVSNLNLSSFLNTNNQVTSSSFQLRFGQEDDGRQSSLNDSDGFIFDELKVFDPGNDMQTQLVSSPSTGCVALSSNQSISITVKNNGSSAISNVPVFYQVNAGSIVSDTITATINTGATQAFTFATTTNMSTTGLYSVKAWCGLSSDFDRSNDTITQVIIRAPLISTFPYYENFESSDGSFMSTGTNSSWAWGIPSASIIDTAANGTKAWVTNLSGNYNNNELSYLYTPCFDLGTSIPYPSTFILSFNLNYSTEPSNDKLWIEYSTDGTTWTKLTNNSGTNWYTSSPLAWNGTGSGWKVTTTSFSTLILSNRYTTQFRFVFSSDGSTTNEGVAIDDVHLFYGTGSQVYTGTGTTVSATSSGAGWVDFISGGQRVAMIYDNGQPLGNVDISVTTGNTDRIYSSQHVLGRNFVITPANDFATGPFTVRLYVTSSEVDSLMFYDNLVTSIHDLGVTKYDGVNEDLQYTNDTGTFIFYLPRVIKKIPYNNGYYLEFRVNEFSEFWINSGGITHTAPLPVTWLNFEAVKHRETAILQWSTAAEKNNDFFTVEASAAQNNFTFEPIGTVPSAHTSTSVQSYQFTDETPHKDGIRYYRIKQTDYNGNYTYSQVKSLYFENMGSVTLYPNPTNGTVYLNINNPAPETGIVITDFTGRTLFMQTFKNPGSDAYTLELEKFKLLKPGIYFIKLLLPDQSIDFKVVKE